MWLGGVFGQEEDAAGVGDFRVAVVGIGGFCGVEGLPGFFEVLLFEVEVGEGYVDFGVAGMDGWGEGEGLGVVLAGVWELAAAAEEVSAVEECRDAGIGVCR